MQGDQAQLAALTVALDRALDRAWPLLDVEALSRTLPGWKQAVAGIVTQLSKASATLAGRTYLADRAAAGLTDPFRPPLAPPPPAEQINKTLDWATKDLWTRDLTPEKVTVARTQISGATQKLVADPHRATTRSSILADRFAVGYVRIARPDCCAFCRMLASRGAVYTSAKAAGEAKASELYGPDAQGVANRYHDHCHCIVRPVFSRDAVLPEHNQQWADEWAEVTKGLFGRAARIAWRRHVEGR